MAGKVPLEGFVDFNFAGLPPQIVRFRIGRAPVVTDRIALDAREFDWASHQAGIYRYFFVRHTALLPAGHFPSGAMQARSPAGGRAVVDL